MIRLTTLSTSNKSIVIKTKGLTITTSMAIINMKSLSPASGHPLKAKLHFLQVSREKAQCSNPRWNPSINIRNLLILGILISNLSIEA